MTECRRSSSGRRIRRHASFNHKRDYMEEGSWRPLPSIRSSFPLSWTGEGLRVLWRFFSVWESLLRRRLSAWWRRGIPHFENDWCQFPEVTLKRESEELFHPQVSHIGLYWAFCELCCKLTTDEIGTRACYEDGHVFFSPCIDDFLEVLVQKSSVQENVIRIIFPDSEEYSAIIFLVKMVLLCDYYSIEDILNCRRLFRSETWRTPVRYPRSAERAGNRFS